MIVESYRVVAPDRYLRTRFVDDRLRILYGDNVIVETDDAVQLLEGDRAEVTYVPLDAIDGATLLASGTEYHCRWKGDATYHDVRLSNGDVIPDGAWSYPDAPEELALLQSRVAFDTARFTERFTTESGSFE